MAITSISNNCTSTTPATINIGSNLSTPTLAATGSQSVALGCGASSVVVLSATANPAGSTYTWTSLTGSFVSAVNNSTVSLNGVGTYTLRSRHPVTGCISSIVFTVTPAVPPTFVSGITASSASITCINPTVFVSGGPTSGVTYTWTGPSVVSGVNTRTAGVNATGIYSLAITSISNNCTSITPATINIGSNLSTPILTATGSQSVALGCGASSVVVLSATATPAGITYTWTSLTGSFVSAVNNSTVSLNGVGTYTLRSRHPVTGCISSIVFTVTPAVPPTFVSGITASSASITCINPTVFVSGGPTSGVTYTWTGPSVVSGVNTRTAGVNAPGIYSLAITSISNNCTSITPATINIGSNLSTPILTATGSQSVALGCGASSVVVLSATATPAGSTYTWTSLSGGFVSGVNNSTVSLNGVGTYTLNAKHPISGCNANPIVFTVTPAVPPTFASTITASSASITCINPTVSIIGGPTSGVTYTWTGPSVVSGVNTRTAGVNAPGIYSLAITSISNNCTSITPATINIGSNLVTPTLTANNQTAISGCGSATVVVFSGTTTPAGSTYTWVSSAGFVNSVNNSQTVLANGIGTYSLISQYPVSGCTVALVYTITPSTNAPILTTFAFSNTLTCFNPQHMTTVFSFPPAVTYSWTGPGIVGANNLASVTGSLPGIYNLTATRIDNNCINAFIYTLFADNTPITPNVSSSNAINCISTTAILNTAPTPMASAFNYTWSTGSNMSSIAVSPTVNTTYTVTVLNPINGCSGSATQTVIANTIPPSGLAVTPNTFTTTCLTPAVQLSANATGATTYSWIAPSSTGNIIGSSNTATTNVSGYGHFTVIATAANGCSAPAQVSTIYSDITVPSYSLSNNFPTINCLDSSPTISVVTTALMPTSPYTYVWTPTIGIAGLTNTSAVTFTAPGTYTGVITAVNSGCQSTTLITVSTATVIPTMVAGTGTAQAISCIDSTVTLAPVFTPSDNLTYLWSGIGIVGVFNEPSVKVNQNGTYSITVTNSLTGCGNTLNTIPVFGNTVGPNLNVSSSSSIGITCQPNKSPLQAINTSISTMNGLKLLISLVFKQ